MAMLQNFIPTAEQRELTPLMDILSNETQWNYVYQMLPMLQTE